MVTIENIRSWTELTVGDAVFHSNYGLGRYRGLQSITTGGQTNEFLSVEYANSELLYIPISYVADGVLCRYVRPDPENTPPVHTL
jgi:transcription-repair coupling factor (superfamily II helicase)